VSSAFEIGQITITYNRAVDSLLHDGRVRNSARQLRYTSLGLEMRAVTQIVEWRRRWELRPHGRRADVWPRSGIAGIAGVALSQIDNVSPNLGQSYIIDSFMWWCSAASVICGHAGPARLRSASPQIP